MKCLQHLVFVFIFRVCETGPPNNQPLNGNQQRDCEYFVDSLFEEAEKVGAKCLSPTEQKKQVNVCYLLASRRIHKIKTMFVIVKLLFTIFIMLYLHKCQKSSDR